MSSRDPGAPSKNDVGFFDDDEKLRVPTDARSEGELADIFRALLRADLGGLRPGAVLQCITSAEAGERERLLHGLCEALKDDDLVRFIEEDAARRQKAIDMALKAAPPDPSPHYNTATISALRGFSEWKPYAYQILIVPGYTPLDTKKATPGVHPVTKRRLEQAMKDVEERRAPFILVTGGNVYPRGTPYHEAIEMKRELVAMGFPEDRILVEARARHSTTNLRNSGRYMVEHGIRAGLITTAGGGVLGSDLFDQDFYFSNPTMSTFHGRCERELGYRVGELRGAGDFHTEFVPSANVRRINYRDPLDP